MKKRNFSFVIILLAIAFAFTSCGSDKPQKVVKQAYENMIKENYAEAFKDYVNKHDKPFTEEEINKLVKMLEEDSKDETMKVKSVKIVSEEISDDGESAVVKLSLTKYDGSVNEVKEKLRKVDGDWKIVFNMGR